jgi:hypothetical protein
VNCHTLIVVRPLGLLHPVAPVHADPCKATLPSRPASAFSESSDTPVMETAFASVRRPIPGCDRIDAPFVFDGPINGEAFQLYVDKIGYMLYHGVQVPQLVIAESARVRSRVDHPIENTEPDGSPQSPCGALV